MVRVLAVQVVFSLVHLEERQVRSVVPFLFLGLYDEQGKVMFMVLVSHKSIS